MTKTREPRTRLRSQMWFGIVVALLGATVLVVGLMYVGAALSSGQWNPRHPEARPIQWEDVAKVALPGAALIAALIGAVIAGYGHNARLDELALSRDSDVTDRYTKAVEQLGNSDQLAIRLGGVYALERIHGDSERDRSTIQNLLNTFITANAPQPERPTDDLSPQDYVPGHDVEAALQALGRLRSSDVRLSGLSLRDNNLPGATLPDAKANDTDLSHAVMTRAYLIRANLDNATLTGARLDLANLQQATLAGANLTQTHLTEANLSQARLQQAVLRRAYLGGANLDGAKLHLADLSRAVLTEANLGGADLREANLENAELSGADLRSANLNGADLSDANLTGANLQQATFDGTDLSGANLNGVEVSLTFNLPASARPDPQNSGFLSTTPVSPLTGAHWDPDNPPVTNVNSLRPFLTQQPTPK